jgi:hypothetical protein
MKETNEIEADLESQFSEEILLSGIKADFG